MRSHGTIFFWHHLLRGDVEKIGEFQDEKIRSHGSNFLVSPLGGDVEEIGSFQERNIRSHDTIFWQEGN